MMEAVSSSDTSVNNYQTTQRSIPEVGYIYGHSRIWNLTKYSYFKK
jgi:hypothetical protein